MKKVLPFWLLLVCSFVLIQCNDNASVKKIESLEKRIAQTPSIGAVDSLIALYGQYVQKHPDDHERDFDYLTKAADLQFDKKDDAVKAVKWLHEALEKHPQANLTQPIGVLTRIWAAYIYKAAPTVRLDPDDIDKTKAVLLKNQNWIDSSLVRLDKSLGAAQGAINKVAAGQFIETSEAYAALVQSGQPDKYADLLIKAGALAKSVENPNKAIQLYYNVGEKMPEHPKAPTALFMMGFIYENDLGDTAKAKEIYQTFLARYPNDPDYADDAQNALKFLGKTPEEIIREFEKNNSRQAN